MGNSKVTQSVYICAPANNDLRKKNHIISSDNILNLLSFTRSSYKTVFVNRGDELHLLVYLNEFSEYPFLRVPISELHRAANEYNRVKQNA